MRAADPPVRRQEQQRYPLPLFGNNGTEGLADPRQPDPPAAFPSGVAWATSPLPLGLCLSLSCLLVALRPDTPWRGGRVLDPAL